MIDSRWDDTLAGTGELSYEEAPVSLEEALRANVPRILFMGARKSGKSSIEQVVFHKMSPHETLFLDPTANLDIHSIANNKFIQFQTWDFAGDVTAQDDVVYEGRQLTEQQVFEGCTTLVYVVDAQEEDYEDALPRLVDTISRAHMVNPSINFEVFVHKVDGDFFMSEEQKNERQRDIQQYVSMELSELNEAVVISYHLTSIYDHSVLEAFSKVIQKMVPQLPTLENLLDILISTCNIDKSFLVDVATKLYIATDSNPVNMQSYELCSDMIDVVIDVSYIYGVSEDESGQETGSAYDSNSAAAIRLSSGMVLYMREVSSYLALVCIIRADNFTKRALLDYNIDCLKEALEKVFFNENA